MGLVRKITNVSSTIRIDAVDSEEGAEEVMALFWPQVKKKRGVRPIVRRYLTEYMKSRFLRIELSEMLIACTLPVERFYTGVWGKKKRVQPRQVFRDTRRSIMTNAY